MARAWEPSGCQADPDLPPECFPVERRGRLRVRNGRPWGGHVELSDDQGESWFLPELPSAPDDGISDLSLAGRNDGAWLAVVTETKEDDRETWDEQALVRSDDGRRWEVVFEHDSRCAGSPFLESVSTPVRFGRRWLLAYRCNQPVEGVAGPELSLLYLLDDDGIDLRAVARTTETDRWYGQPVAIDGGVIVPVRSSETGEVDELRLFGTVPGG